MKSAERLLGCCSVCLVNIGRESNCSVLWWRKKWCGRIWTTKKWKVASWCLRNCKTCRVGFQYSSTAITVAITTNNGNVGCSETVMVPVGQLPSLWRSESAQISALQLIRIQWFSVLLIVSRVDACWREGLKIIRLKVGVLRTMTSEWSFVCKVWLWLIHLNARVRSSIKGWFRFGCLLSAMSPMGRRTPYLSGSSINTRLPLSRSVSSTKVYCCFSLKVDTSVPRSITHLASHSVWTAAINCPCARHSGRRLLSGVSSLDKRGNML